jgi:site-specific DNA recombinase
MIPKGKTGWAVLYIRVSTDEQAIGHLNLENQEKRCREYCLREGWQVVKVFIDSGESARTLDRPEFQRMLAYCRTHRREVQFVVVQDLSRFARNNRDQAQTIAELRRIGVFLRSTYESNIDETAAGTMAANLFGTFNQYFSDALSEKMRDRTRQALKAGRFPWRAPLGFRNVGGKEGPNIVPDEHAAPLIRRAFELMETSNYKKAEVLKIVVKEGLSTARGKRLSAQTLHALLRNPLYAGWVTLPSDESFEPVRGLHEPIVSQGLFDRVQAILDGRRPSSAPKRKINPAFPLKCFVKCDSCGVPLTGGMCSGRTKTYPYYWCRSRKCRAVKLRGEQMEAEFLELLRRLRPEADDLSAFPKMVADAWEAQQGDAKKEGNRLEARLDEQKRRKRKLLDSMLDGTISQDTYREANEQYCAEIAVTEQELAAMAAQRSAKEICLSFAKIHLMDIAGAWELAAPEQRVRVQNLLFDGGLAYSPEFGILNRSKSSLFSVLEALSDPEAKLVSPTGFEPVLPP